MKPTDTSLRDFLKEPGKAKDRLKTLSRRQEHLAERVRVRGENFDKAELSALNWAVDALKNQPSDMEDYANAKVNRVLDKLIKEYSYPGNRPVAGEAPDAEPEYVVNVGDIEAIKKEEL